MLATATRRILLEPNPRRAFLASLRAVMGDVRLLWIPEPNETVAVRDLSPFGHLITHGTALAARLVRLRRGASLVFNGSSDYASTPDADSLSFGNGTADQAFSIISVGNTTNTGGQRNIVTKYANANAEWLFTVNVADQVALYLFDQSAGGTNANRVAAATMDSWRILGATYTAATGGATAANDITLYESGAALTPLATTNSGTYVAMENLTSVVEIGSQSAHAVNFYQGSLALVAVCAKALSASDHAAIASLCRAYFGVAL